MKKISLTIILFFLLDFTLGQSEKTIKDNVDLKSYGKKILDGKVKPTEDKETYQIVDSLLAIYSADADFYFNVFNKILQTSDGALSQHVSTVASKYYFNFTNRFIPRAKKMTKTSLKTWFHLIAFDLYIKNYEGVNGLTKIKADIKSKTTENFVVIDSKTLDFLFECNDKIYVETERMVKQD